MSFHRGMICLNQDVSKLRNNGWPIKRGGNSHCRHKETTTGDVHCGIQTIMLTPRQVKQKMSSRILKQWAHPTYPSEEASVRIMWPGKLRCSDLKVSIISDSRERQQMHEAPNEPWAETNPVSQNHFSRGCMKPCRSTRLNLVQRILNGTLGVKSVHLPLKNLLRTKFLSVEQIDAMRYKDKETAGSCGEGESGSSKVDSLSKWTLEPPKLSITRTNVLINYGFSRWNSWHAKPSTSIEDTRTNCISGGLCRVFTDRSLFWLIRTSVKSGAMKDFYKTRKEKGRHIRVEHEQ